jgi:nickel-dependent lactate racemase
MAPRTIHIELACGDTCLKFDMPEKNLLEILSASGRDSIDGVSAALDKAILKPIGSPPLSELLKKINPQNPLIIASDHTRTVPYYSLILDRLLDEFQKAGIGPNLADLLIATGNHRAPSCEEREAMYGPKAFDQLNLYAHNCDQNCIALSRLANGREVEVNQRLLESDFIIATGKITPHYLAGYSGGRKAVMPGCASRSSIAANHAMIARRKNGPGRLKDNPIHLEMTEVASLAGIDFLINIVPTPDDKIAGLFAGHWQKAWESGVDLCRQVWSVEYGGLADCIIASAGGYPLDINLYQMQRVLNNLERAVKPGGTIVLVGQCREGVGQEGFGHWMERYSIKEILSTPEENITAEAHRAYATAQVLDKCEVLLISSIEKFKTQELKFRFMPDCQSALDYLKHKHGADYKCYVVPQGNSIMLGEGNHKRSFGP